MPCATAQKILGNGFVECNTRQTAHDIYSAGKRLFAECFLSGTRQILCRELKPTLDKKKHDSAETVTTCLPSVQDLTLSKAAMFAECPSPVTRQICPGLTRQKYVESKKSFKVRREKKLISLPSAKKHSAKKRVCRVQKKKHSAAHASLAVSI